MSYSLNEVEALAKRATRGAGRSWGMAEEAAKAVRWLQANDLSGAELLLALLVQNDGVPITGLVPMSMNGAWVSASGRLCPLAAGSALCDISDRLVATGRFEMKQVSYPLLVVPFAGSLGYSVALSWGSVRICVDAAGLHITDPDGAINTPVATVMDCTVLDATKARAKPPSQRANVTEHTWEGLTQFAHRTYAPATEASRTLGAGAGVSDND